MRVTLAGMTGCLGRGDLPPSSPETITAAYARISRSPRSVEDLRRRAARDINGSRAFNRKIIHHLGHRSVSEHAVFNLDIVGISRLAVETVERTRLASYTEKSQRYVRLGEDFHIPKETRGAGLAGAFADLCRRQHERYRLLESELGRQFSKGRAKEDARYILGLATTAQLGLTINARALESMLRRLERSRLAECRHLARGIRQLISRITPSLLTDTTAEDDGLHEVDLINKGEAEFEFSIPGPRLLWYTPEPETVLAAANGFETHVHGLDLSSTTSYPLFETSGKRRTTKSDNLPRSFETIQFAFELIVSSSCFAQLKRHRMATVLAQPYDPALGITIPPNIKKAGLSAIIEEAALDSEEMAIKLSGVSGEAATYPLLNAHRRRVLLVINARSFGNLAALRLDRHAQWDIRLETVKMVNLIHTEIPDVAQALGLPKV